MVEVALSSYFQTPASEPNLTNPDEVHEAIRGLKFGKTPGPNGIPNIRLEASFPASGIPAGTDIYRNSPRPSLPFLVEARSRDLYP